MVLFKPQARFYPVMESPPGYGGIHQEALVSHVISYLTQSCIFVLLSVKSISHYVLYKLTLRGFKLNE